MVDTATLVTEPGRDFIRDIVQADVDSGRAQSVVTRFPPEPNGFCIRPRQVDLPEFRDRAGFRRPLSSTLRRHQPDQGRAGFIDAILADVRWLGFGWVCTCTTPRITSSSCMTGRNTSLVWLRLCRRHAALRHARPARHADRARLEQPLPGRGRWRRTSTCSTACGRANSPTAPACCARRSTWRRAT